MSAGPITENDHVLIVGAGLAGLRTAQGLRDGGFTGCITMVGDEPHPPYVDHWSTASRCGATTAWARSAEQSSTWSSSAAMPPLRSIQKR